MSIEVFTELWIDRGLSVFEPVLIHHESFVKLASLKAHVTSELIWRWLVSMLRLRLLDNASDTFY